MKELVPVDSREDTFDHIKRVRQLMNACTDNLDKRALFHDLSKLEEPEKSGFDRLKALLLSGMDYGSEEYKECLQKERATIDHHYAKNSHHPEYFANKIDGMSLLDILEMLADWRAATERMKNGGNIWKSLEINAKRFNISSQLVNILGNTILEMEKVDPKIWQPVPKP